MPTTHDSSERTTLCWYCSKSYPIADSQCPHCGAKNGNVDWDGTAQSAETIARLEEEKAVMREQAEQSTDKEKEA